LVSAVPAVDAVFHYQRYADYQNILIERVHRITVSVSGRTPP
jgi:hypothetical protein